MATPKGGNFGKVLEIDLSTQTYKTRTIPDEVYQQFVGARGLGAYFAVKEYKAAAPTSPARSSGPAGTAST